MRHLSKRDTLSAKCEVIVKELFTTSDILIHRVGVKIVQQLVKVYALFSDISSWQQLKLKI